MNPDAAVNLYRYYGDDGYADQNGDPPGMISGSTGFDVDALSGWAWTTFTPVPEPSAFLFMGVAAVLAGLFGWRWRA